MSLVGGIPYRPKMANEMNHSWGFREKLDMSFSPRQEPYVANLMDFDPMDSKATTIDHEELFPELVLLRKRVADEEDRHMRLEKK